MTEIGDLDAECHAEVRGLILSGLAEHWGPVDPGLNPDLDDMLVTYASGRTVVARDDDGHVVGTGTVVPRSATVAEVLRMSVHADSRRGGIGSLVLTELIETVRRWNLETVVLETSSAWTEAISFYRDFGFRITHLEEGEFGSDTWFALDLSRRDGEPL